MSPAWRLAGGQQPGRARRADGETAAEDLRRLAVGDRCLGVPRGPLLPVHRPQERPARPRRAPRPVHPPALAAEEIIAAIDLPCLLYTSTGSVASETVRGVRMPVSYT